MTYTTSHILFLGVGLGLSDHPSSAFSNNAWVLYQLGSAAFASPACNKQPWTSRTILVDPERTPTSMVNVISYEVGCTSEVHLPTGTNDHWQIPRPSGPAALGAFRAGEGGSQCLGLGLKARDLGRKWSKVVGDWRNGWLGSHPISWECLCESTGGVNLNSQMENWSVISWEKSLWSFWSNLFFGCCVSWFGIWRSSRKSRFQHVNDYWATGGTAACETGIPDGIGVLYHLPPDLCGSIILKSLHSFPKAT